MKYEILKEEQLSEMLSLYRQRVLFNIENNIKQWDLDDVTWESLSREYAIEDFRVLMIDNKIVAAMAIVDIDLFYWQTIPKAESLYLHKLCVDPKFSGHAYAELMLSMFIEEGRDLGISDVRLDVRSYKDKLIQLYESCGFIYDSTIQVHNEYKTHLYRYNYKNHSLANSIRFKDDIWPAKGITHTRYTVRALAHKENSYALLRIRGCDEFLDRDHLESIGGGVEEGESKLLAIHREVYEETGYLCRVEKYITTIIDEYNLIHRKTVSTFYEVELKEYIGHTKRTASEQVLFFGLEWFDKSELLKSLEYQSKKGVNYLVQRRDYTAASILLNNK